MARDALLIIDFSNDYVDDDGGLTVGKPAQNIVEKLVKRAEDFIGSDNVIVICMDTHKENDTHFKLWARHNVKGTWGHKLYGEMQVWYEQHKENPNVMYVPKQEYDAFYNTDLHARLQHYDVERVYLTGVCTDICVFLTAYGAHARGYKTVVYKDGTATFTNNHNIFLNHMNTIFNTEIM